MKKILPFVCTMFISFSAWGVTCDAGYYLPDGADECVICPAGKYSEAGASSCSNVYAGYFCSGGCKTATPTSDEDCLTGNTCGQCWTDSVTGRPAYSTAGSASCTACPEVTGDLVGRVYSYGGWWSDDIHDRIGGCSVGFNVYDPDATYRTRCYYNAEDGAYGGANSKCETVNSGVRACAAGKYNTLTSASEWIGDRTRCNGVDCMKGKVCTDTTAGYYSPEGATTQTACPAGTYSAAGASTCTACPAGKYSAAGVSSCSNVSAGYFCSGGCTTATPTSDEDCLTGNTCGKCTTDATTGRPAYSGAGAASCLVCPEVTDDLAGRVRSYSGYWNDNDIHDRIGGCGVFFNDDDPDATYRTKCFYSSTNGAYGGPNSKCEVYPYYVDACAAGKYNTVTSASEWSGSRAVCYGVDCMNGKVCTDTTAGYYSPEGAKTQTACPAGTYSATAGAASCSNVSTGYYTTGCTDGTACTGQSQCTGTTYCVNGMQYSCPTGYTANTTDGKSAISQCQATCAAGNYIASGTYTQVEYLETTGTQYIVTGISGPARWIGSAQSSAIQDKSQCILGADLKENGLYSANVFLASQVKNTTKWSINTTKKGTSSVPTTDYAEYVMDFGVTNFSGVINGESLSARSYDGFTTWNIGFCYGAATNYPFVGKIYTQKAYQNNVLVFDGVPARRNSDNTLGMLDLVSGQFLTNAGTGTFTAGPDVAQIGGTCSDTSTAGHYAAATTIGYGTPAPQTACASGTYSAAVGASSASTCTACPAGEYSSAGASTCTACPVGTFAPTASPVCYPHRLHIGDDVVYVRSTKLTTPSLNIDIDRDGVADFFVNMTTTRTRMNKDSEHYFHAQWENNDYYICDDTTCPQ